MPQNVRFEEKHTSQQDIENSGRSIVEIELCLWILESIENLLHCGEWKQNGVKIGSALALEPAVFQQSNEISLGVAAIVMVDVVMLAP